MEFFSAVIIYVLMIVGFFLLGSLGDFIKKQKDRYDWRGFDENGIHKNGTLYDDEGYDKDGYNRDGYNRLGYNKNGYDKDGYDKNGYNTLGFNKDGYNKYGYNVSGYNKDGFDRNGRNREGYDTQGFDKYGYDKEGYNQNGFDKQGYNREGYDQNGYNKLGYNKNGYIRNGFDINGYSQEVHNKDEFNKLGNNQEEINKNSHNQSESCEMAKCISEEYKRCYAYSSGYCKILSNTNFKDNQCPFYDPFRAVIKKREPGAASLSTLALLNGGRFEYGRKIGEEYVNSNNQTDIDFSLPEYRYVSIAFNDYEICDFELGEEINFPITTSANYSYCSSAEEDEYDYYHRFPATYRYHTHLDCHLFWENELKEHFYKNNTWYLADANKIYSGELVKCKICEKRDTKE